MIENKIDELIAAIDRLTAAMGQQVTAAPAPKSVPKSAPEPEIKPTVTAPSVADKVADLENRCRALARKDNKVWRPRILEMLETTYGTRTIKEVPESKLDELSEKLAALEAES